MIKDLSPIFWLWIPAFAIVLQAILEITLDNNLMSQLHSENGPHETLQAVIMLFAFLYSLKVLLLGEAKTTIFKMWFGLAALCSFYVVGEEISWGQHVWDWATPDYWAEVNDQEETNFHNTSSWLDQKPRLILFIGIVVGTLIIPILKKRKWVKLPSELDALLPSTKLSLIAFIILVPYLLEKTFEIFDIVIFVRFSEVQELYMFYFVLLYLIMLRQKVVVST